MRHRYTTPYTHTQSCVSLSKFVDAAIVGQQAVELFLHVGNLRIHVSRKSARFQCGRGGEHGTQAAPRPMLPPLRPSTPPHAPVRAAPIRRIPKSRTRVRRVVRPAAPRNARPCGDGGASSRIRPRIRATDPCPGRFPADGNSCARCGNRRNAGRTSRWSRQSDGSGRARGCVRLRRTRRIGPSLR